LFLRELLRPSGEKMEPAAGDLLRRAASLAAGAGDSARVSARAARVGVALLVTAGAWVESGEEEVGRDRAGDGARSDGGLKLGWE